LVVRGDDCFFPVEPNPKMSATEADVNALQVPERTYDASTPAPSVVLAPYYAPARSMLPAFLRQLAYFVLYGGSCVAFMAVLYQVGSPF
jgi:hypothetical protein